MIGERSGCSLRGASRGPAFRRAWLGATGLPTRAGIPPSMARRYGLTARAGIPPPGFHARSGMPQGAIKRLGQHDPEAIPVSRSVAVPVAPIHDRRAQRLLFARCVARAGIPPSMARRYGASGLGRHSAEHGSALRASGQGRHSAEHGSALRSFRPGRVSRRAWLGATGFPARAGTPRHRSSCEPGVVPGLHDVSGRSVPCGGCRSGTPPGRSRSRPGSTAGCSAAG